MKTEWEIFKETCDTDRRKRDLVEDLIKQDGFYWGQPGKEGIIYWVAKGQLCELEYEVGWDIGNGGDIISINVKQVKEYVLPAKKDMTDLEKEQVKILLVEWLAQNKIKAKLW